MKKEIVSDKGNLYNKCKAESGLHGCEVAKSKAAVSGWAKKMTGK